MISDTTQPVPTNASLPNLVRTRFVCPLVEVDDSRLYGNKAFNLSCLCRAAVLVPQGYVIADDAFREFREAYDLDASIARILEGMNAFDPAALATAASSISEFICARPLLPELTGMLECFADDLQRQPWVVRSSAAGEDSNQAAFPGMLDSILHVRSVPTLHDAIRRCWASYWSPRALFYRASRHVELGGMGVIIQRQVPAAISGVMFTRFHDPADGKEEKICIEYCEGLADSLVSGHITPKRLFLSVTPSAARDEDASFSTAEAVNGVSVPAAQLKLAATRLEEVFGSPQDVEWSTDADGHLYILQSRPITAGRQVTAETHSQDELSDIVIYSNANVNENYPEPITPLLYSIASEAYYYYFRNLGLRFGFARARLAAMEEPLRHIIAVQGGRMYYNLTNIHSVLHMAPFGGFFADAFDQFTGASGNTRQDPSRTWRGYRRNRLLVAGEMCRVIWDVRRRFKELPRGVRQFEQTVDRFAQATSLERVAHAPLDALLEHLRAFFYIRRHRWFYASLADAASMISYGLLKRFLRREFPEAESVALHNTLLKGLQNVVSAQPVIQLWELSRTIRQDETLLMLFRDADAETILTAVEQDPRFQKFQSEWQRYLTDWGFRRSGELLLTRPSFEEEPASLIELLRAYVQQEGDSPAARLAQQNVARREETARLLNRLRERSLSPYVPFVSKASLAKRLITWAQQAIAFRERARHKQALLYSRVRGIALLIGAHLVKSGYLEDAADIFFLSFPEIESVLERHGDATVICQQIASRKQHHEDMSKLMPPERLELPRGKSWSEHTGARDTARDNRTSAASNILTGAGVCGGNVEGRAAVLHDISEHGRLKSGDILVCPQTDPGWGPLFFLIRGLVIERGGMLSHGAILAREYGIPTVVGVADATKNIAHGCTLRVDGDRGDVELLD